MFGFGKKMEEPTNEPLKVNSEDINLLLGELEDSLIRYHDMKTASCGSDGIDMGTREEKITAGEIIKKIENLGDLLSEDQKKKLAELKEAF